MRASLRYIDTRYAHLFSSRFKSDGNTDIAEHIGVVGARRRMENAWNDCFSISLFRFGVGFRLNSIIRKCGFWYGNGLAFTNVNVRRNMAKCHAPLPSTKSNWIEIVFDPSDIDAFQNKFEPNLPPVEATSPSNCTRRKAKSVESKTGCVVLFFLFRLFY